LTPEEIRLFARGAADASIPDYQLAALLMAICWRGMNAQETACLTMEMMHSGSVIDLSAIDGVCVDKHSTGGVGDTTTLVLVPLAAACGAKVAKISGRGLGHTGGTLDKLESIPGCGVEMTQERFIRQVQEIGCAVIGQTQDLCPADKALYALRDVTGTVDCVPLIASSIVSKKLASGAGAIVLDVKTGSGALMRTLEESIELAKAMVDIGTQAGKPILALVTGMDQPLGTHVGNALEVKEAIDILSGRAGGDLLAVSMELGSRMLIAAGLARDTKEGKARMQAALESGAGLEKLREMITVQGGDGRVCDDVGLLPQAAHRIAVPAPRSGYIAQMDTTQIGYVAQGLGAGRKEKDDVIDPAVGLVMNVRIGDSVEKGQPLATLHVNNPAMAGEAAARMQQTIRIADEKPVLPPLVYAAVSPQGVEGEEGRQA
ncbi:MAG TPA: thymidine phosphorylase, partial [Candidatus Ventricola intestinavium]|nr:thymidine phosphorylase [Candidatus Ventricola intestinavium]